MTATGSATNLANFSRLTTIVRSLGGSYDPSSASLKLDSLEAKLAEAEAAMAVYSEKKRIVTTLVTDRTAAFDELTQIISKVRYIASSTVGNEGFDEDLRTLLRQASGRRRQARRTAPAPPAVEGEEPPDASRGGQMLLTFDNRLEALRGVIDLLRTRTDYDPNEPEMRISGLEAKYAELAGFNRRVRDAMVDAENARKRRDAVFYEGAANIMKTAKACKKYIKGVYGARSPESRQVTGLSFKQP